MMQHIETIELDSSQASITFSSIPQDYDDLVIICSLRTSRVGSEGALRLRLGNGTLVTGSNYDAILLRGDGSGVSSASVSNTAQLASGTMPASGATTNTFGNAIFYISNYTSSTNKSISVDSVMENNSAFSVQNIVAGIFNTTNSVDIASVFEDVDNLVAGSTASLYGITAGGDGTVTTS